MYRNTFVEIDLDALASNTQNIKERFSDYEYFFGVLKGNAYGHGEYIVNTLVDNGVNYIAVSDIDEALRVRQHNKTIPILCLIPVQLDNIEVCLKNNLTVTVHDLKYAQSMASLKLTDKLKIHLKVDSGMNRLGFTDKESLQTAMSALSSNRNITTEGIYTHFATSGIYDPHYNNQVDKFIKTTSLINLSNIKIIHADRSLTTMSHRKLPFTNGMRIGISIYGYSQLPRPTTGIRGHLRLVKNRLRVKVSRVENVSLARDLDLTPALSMFSEVIQTKTAPKGSLIGYGETIAGTDLNLAIVSAGYADGIDLRRSGGYVTINGDHCKIIGTVNMNSIIVATKNMVSAGDRVEILGSNTPIRIASAHIGTTIYETMTSIPRSIPRAYIRNGKTVHVEQ